jgi:lysophospholipase L1-like esterase
MGPKLPDADFGVRFVGRVDATDPAGARLAWSGTGLVARFKGTTVAVEFSSGQQYTVVVDGQAQPKYVPSGGLDTIAEGLADGEHVLEIYRRTEANQGESTFRRIEVEDGELLAPPAPPPRRIEIVGDSISCGYGNEGTDNNCRFSADTQNHYLTYGAIAARAVAAELSTIAWSGKGVVCNYGDDASSCTNPLPTYYDRTLPNRADSLWNFSKRPADAVVVNLSTNDFSTSLDPTQEEFESAYVTLLERIRAAHPNAVILCTVGPMLTGSDLSTARRYIGNAVKARVEAGDDRVATIEFAPQDASNGHGCDWHPSLRTHEIMAQTLTGVLRVELGWAD